MKKIIALILAVFMTVCASSFCVIASDNTAVMSASNVEAQAGESVKITVSLENCVDITALSFMLSYDETIFELVSGTVLVADTIIEQVDIKNNVALFKFDGINFNANADLFEFTFLIDEDAKNGTYEISFDRIVIKQLVLDGETDVEVVSKSGAITIESNESTTVTQPIIEKPLAGDVNEDKKVNAADARLILRVSAKLDVLSPDLFEAADVNKDEKINAADARIVLRVSAKLEKLN